MKKMIILVMAVIMLITTGCSTGARRNAQHREESREDETRRILTSYIGVEDVEEGTEFEFIDRESAEDFMYYWLDYGHTVSGIIYHTDTNHYYVTIAEEERFDEVCRATLNSYGGYGLVASEEYWEELNYNNKVNQW